MMIPCSSCAGTANAVLGILEGRSSGKVVLQLLGPYLKIFQLGQAGHKQQGSWLAPPNLLLSLNSYCLLQDRAITKRRVVSKGMTYSESQTTEKMIGLYPKTKLLELNGRSKVKHFLALFSLRSGRCFQFLPLCSHSQVGLSGCFL